MLLSIKHHSSSLMPCSHETFGGLQERGLWDNCSIIRTPCDIGNVYVTGISANAQLCALDIRQICAVRRPPIHRALSARPCCACTFSSSVAVLYALKRHCDATVVASMLALLSVAPSRHKLSLSQTTDAIIAQPALAAWLQAGLT